MQIKSQFDHRGKTYKVTYTDGVPEVENLETQDGVHSYCFYGDKLVIVGHGADNNWTPPGGAIEKGETYTEAAIREIKEESNMKVLHIECIGYQDVEVSYGTGMVRQFRMMAIVKPYGEFEKDPDGDILERKLIDPKDYKEYIKWGEIGDYLMKRALEMKEHNFEDVTKDAVVNPIELAKRFASKKFAEIQTGNHFLDVYRILKEEFGVNDEEVLIAGLLHDTLEDTSATYDQIERIFGKRVADLVEEVSHPKNYNNEQKKEYYEKLKHISDGGKMIKLADFKSHLVNFIGAFTGKNNLKKFTYTEYTDNILSFLENYPESAAKNTVYNLSKELEGHILGK